MSQTVEITIAAAGTDTGPFNLFSDADSYTTAFETGVLKADLLSGYISSTVPDTATVVRVKSTGNCTNYVDMTITEPEPPVDPITFTVNNPTQFVYPITAGNGSASGTIKNNSGSTIYIYSNFNSGGQSSGTINGDSGFVAGGISLDIPGGPITGFGQNFYSTNYEALPSDNTTYSWSLNKQDGYSSGASLKLVYSTTIGGPVTPLY